MIVPSDVFGLSNGWHGRHWHAYLEVDPAEQAVDRCQRLQREPDAVLDSPDDVAEWIEQRLLELGERRKVRAVVDRDWVEIGDAEDLAHLYGEHVAMASRGDSIYTDAYHTTRRVELYVEAVSADDCDRH